MVTMLYLLMRFISSNKNANSEASSDYTHSLRTLWSTLHPQVQRQKVAFTQHLTLQTR